MARHLDFSEVPLEDSEVYQGRGQGSASNRGIWQHPPLALWVREGGPLGGGCRLSPISCTGPLAMPLALSPSDRHEIDKENRVKVFFPLSAHKIIMLDLSVPLLALSCGDDGGASRNLRAGYQVEL